MYLKLFLLNVLMCGVFCQYLNQNSGFSYELPDGDTKYLNITINNSTYSQFQITFKCYNYDSLKFFEVRLGGPKEIALQHGITLDFIKCFNNATDNENYNYRLSKWFNSLPYFETQYIHGYPLKIQLDKYAEVNCDVLFDNFDFKKFDTVSFNNVGFNSSKFLNQLYCQSCIFRNSGRIDFNEFRTNISDTVWFQTTSTKLINFSPANLKKFVSLITLNINDFDLDDYNTFNASGLFEHNVNLTEINVDNSRGKITLHGEVFRGLKSIQRILLQRLQLDSIPKDLFKDLPELNTVYLSRNNIKIVDPFIFQTNRKFNMISFTDNPFYTEPHNKLESFDLDGKSISLELSNFTAHTFDLLKQLIKNPNITNVSFQSFLIDNFNFTNFTRIQSDRDTLIDIKFQNGVPAFDLAYENIIRPKFDIKTNFTTLIRVALSEDILCHDSKMIKRLFPHYLKNYQDRPGFYFEESRLFVEFIIPTSCYHLDEQFGKTFTENCSKICDCKFISLSNKVKINCNSKNLTEIPHIPYPQQYVNLRAIDLHLENNSLSVLRWANQDANVLKKLASLNLKNNKIQIFPTDEADFLGNIWALNVCGNPFLALDQHFIHPKLASGLQVMNKYSCDVDNEIQRVVDYIQENKLKEINEYLDGLKNE